jgi:octaprenyl-diphosphate synthase
MTGAAILEIETRARTDLTLATWRRIAEGKTGVLFGWCGEAVGLVAGDDAAARALGTFGRHLGVAFQLADDLGDLRGAQGKDRFSDVRSKTPSSVLSLAMAEAPALQQRLARAWAQETVAETLAEEIGSAVLRSGAVSVALELVGHELSLARSAAESVVGPACSAELRLIGERFLEGLRDP